MDDEERLEEPSEEFKRAVMYAGTYSILCELCGRTNFAVAADYEVEEGEMERLIKLSEEKPDEYVAAGCTSISWGTIDGKQVVEMCPCHKLRRYEDWIWDHRYIIATYLKARSKKEKQEAKWQAEKIEDIEITS